MFEFGKNWQSYLDSNDIEVAAGDSERQLGNFLQGALDLRGRTFLDAGCGSGIHSLAAARLGAERIVSFDVDPNSVACCQSLIQRFGQGRQWAAGPGSLLDRDFLAGLGKFDLV